MTYASILIIVITSLGFLNFQSSRFGKLKLKTLSPGMLTLSIIAYGSLHFLVGLVSMLILASILGILVNDFGFPTLQWPFWLSSFYYLGLDYQVPPAVWAVIISSVFSARYEHKLTDKGKRLEQLNDLEQVAELIDSELDRTLLTALKLKNSTVLNGNLPMVRVVLESRKVYVGNLIQCDVLHGKARNVVIQPNHSGFITEDTLELQLTEHYETYFKDRLREDVSELRHAQTVSKDTQVDNLKNIERLYRQFAITIPVERIVAVSLFDMDEYEKILKVKRDQLRSQQFRYS